MVTCSNILVTIILKIVTIQTEILVFKFKIWQFSLSDFILCILQSSILKHSNITQYKFISHNENRLCYLIALYPSHCWKWFKMEWKSHSVTSMPVIMQCPHVAVLSSICNKILIINELYRITTH